MKRFSNTNILKKILAQEFEDISKKAIRYAQNQGSEYSDVRAERISYNAFLIENGEVEQVTSQEDQGIGIRVLVNGAWGFFSISSLNDLDKLESGILDAIKTAKHYSEKKKTKVILSDSKSFSKTIDFLVQKEPTSKELLDIGLECDKVISSERNIKKSEINVGYSNTSKYFANSEGSDILQNYTDVVAHLTATATDSGITQSINITEGGRGGLETLSSEREIFSTARFIAKKSSQLVAARPAKEEKATVVMNPDFVALLTHEILGHPSEADRVLGKEMAWAGGAWWKGKLGEKIGSESLNVFDDPTISGSLGWYGFDDEGNQASRTSLVENGKLANHFQSRETAEIFHTNPTANMRATSYKYMPLIRMACTCIDKGDWEPDEMIKDVKNGYYISNMKVPSIDMKRYNWSISCQFAHKIENGELTDMLRDVIVMGVAPEFFNSIDACGKDFVVRPITNCGKGDPMQSMIMGNGGPTVRGTATVKSVNA